VDEQHIARFERSEHRRQVSGTFDDGPRRGLESDSELVRDDLCERSFSEPGRAVKEKMIERLSPVLRGVARHEQITLQRILSDILVETIGTQPRQCRVLGRAPLAAGAASLRRRLAMDRIFDSNPRLDLPIRWRKHPFSGMLGHTNLNASATSDDEVTPS